MSKLHEVMSPVSEEVVEAIENIANPKWAIPYLGRKLNSLCKAKFKNAESNGFHFELPWEGQVGYEPYNAFDDATFVHELVIEVYPDGPAAGRIKSVKAHHWVHWHSSSNWQDHAESRTYEKREPNDNEIASYKELLDSWTEGGSSEQITELSNALLEIVREQSGKIKVEFKDCKDLGQVIYKSISISFSEEGALTPIEIIINLDHLTEALDYSRVYVEALFSKEERKKLGICEGESWTLQYCLNFFNFLETKNLYQNIEMSLKAWLHKIYCSCLLYREFMNQDSKSWWRDIWWRLEEIIDGKYRIEQNYKLLIDNLPYVESFLCGDPLSKLVGSVTSANDRVEMEVSGLVDPFLYAKIMGEKTYVEFEYAIANGIKWAMYSHGCTEITIDLAKSEEVAPLNEGIAVIPYQINGRIVTNVCASKKGCKNWRKVIFKAPSDADLEVVVNYAKKTKVFRGGYYFPDSPNADDCWVDAYEYFGGKCSELGFLLIWDGTFSGWQKLEDVECNIFCDLGECVFEGCPNLRKVNFGNNAIDIPKNCFKGCRSLTEVGFIWGSVGERAFEGCINLKTVAMMRARSTCSVGEYAFAGCSALECVRIEEDERSDLKSSISRRAFWGCKKLKEIYLPKSIRILEEECFANCPLDCVLHYEGDAFWFVGEKAFPSPSNIYYWGQFVQYNRDEIVLTDLLDKLAIKREEYIKMCLQCKGVGLSIAEIVKKIIMKRNKLIPRGSFPVGEK